MRASRAFYGEMMRTAALALLSSFLLGGGPNPGRAPAATPGSLEVTLWAWERPEDLRFLGGRPNVGVAFLGETLTLDGDELHVSPRRQPLLVAETTPLEAVVRIEWVRGRAIEDTPALRARIVDQLLASAKLPRVRGVQVDFDAPASVRTMYRQILEEARAALPTTTRLSMTAIASWCTSDGAWLESVAPLVDEVVPMVFSMGRETSAVWTTLDFLGGFALPVCSTSVGVAVGERTPRFAETRRAYVFDRHAWTARSFEESMRTLRPSRDRRQP